MVQRLAGRLRVSKGESESLSEFEQYQENPCKTKIYGLLNIQIVAYLSPKCIEQDQMEQQKVKQNSF